MSTACIVSETYLRHAHSEGYGTCTTPRAAGVCSYRVRYSVMHCIRASAYSVSRRSSASHLLSVLPRKYAQCTLHLVSLAIRAERAWASLVSLDGGLFGVHVSLIKYARALSAHLQTEYANAFLHRTFCPYIPDNMHVLKPKCGDMRTQKREQKL